MFHSWQLPHYTFIFVVIATIIGLFAAFIQFKKEMDEAKESREQNRQREEEFKAIILKYEILQESSTKIIDKANENLKIQKNINRKQDAAMSIAIAQIESSNELLKKQSKLIDTQSANFQELAGSEMIPSIEYHIADVLDNGFYMLEIVLCNTDKLTLRNAQVSVKHTESYLPGSHEYSSQIKSGFIPLSHEKFLEDYIPRDMHTLDVPPLSKRKINSSSIKFIKNLILLDK